ncbi:ABC transporter substrate-binding protein [Caldicellulosiruptoraceae bacterium PP1]
MRKMKKLIAVLLIVSFVLSFGIGLNAFAASNSNKATVYLAVANWDVKDKTALIKLFNKAYPNIVVKFLTYDGNVNDFLTAKVSSKAQLPDIVISWESLTYPVSQGWVYPLDEFLQKDNEAKYIPKSILDSFKYGGKTYAVPVWLQFNTFVVNLDLLEELNLDAPKYNWTVDEFKKLAKSATTDEYSGINHLWEFDTTMAGVLNKNTAQWSFDPSKHKFNLRTGGWAAAIKLQKELKAVPGLVSDDLKNDALRKQGKEDDYQKKFGKDADALREGKVLMGFHGTWDYGWLKTLKYKFDMYPMPNDPKIGYRQPVHADYAFMLATAKYPKEAFQLLKWLSYGTQGISARLQYLGSKKDAKGKPAPEWFVPASSSPGVIKAFDKLSYVPGGIKYMLKNLDKTFKCDFYKTEPGWDKAVWEVIFPANEQIRQGKADPAAIAAQIEAKANKALQLGWDDFNKKLKEAEKKFAEIRKQVSGN